MCQRDSPGDRHQRDLCWSSARLTMLNAQYGESSPTTVDPYSDAYNAPLTTADREVTVTRGRSVKTSLKERKEGHERTDEEVATFKYDSWDSYYISSNHRSNLHRSLRVRQGYATESPNLYNQQANPSHVLGVFWLSIRSQERDLEDEFSRFGRVEKVTIVYDQWVSNGRLIMSIA